ncbi:hypothetical protein [Desulfovibrio ferrophilus]|uniref:Uncharacterized protein n=1 Tax=Desulfovibrio ferrophilus TaxID=241368 RepID=A0A2Z6AVQ8_9BACT|nr:hypothetical protein [Desulfovibrio ferrophilus]BBD07324.1 uncharacterized protein DFE_0598 [Desulfovibrio ferrophilus]
MQAALRHANTILADRFESMTQAKGRSEAVVDIKQIVTIGVDIILERTKGRSMNAAQRIVVSAIHAGRMDLLVEEITADIQDMVKARENKFLLEVQTRHGPLTFLPDVLIPADDETLQRWQGFLDNLNPFSLRAEDPVTRLRNRIPFRDSVWMGDLVFAPKMTATVIQDIQEIKGNLMLRGHTTDIKHPLSLDGSLYIDANQLQEGTSCVESLKGHLRIYSESIKTLDELNVSDKVLQQWGAKQGTPVHINDRRSYRFLIEEGPEGLTLALAESPGGHDQDQRSQRYLWKGTGWAQFHRKLSPDIAYRLLRRFRHLCAVLGLGEDFILRERDADMAVENNTERIIVLLDLIQGQHSAKAAQKIPEEQHQLIQTIREHLLRLKALAMGEGKEYYRDMEQVGTDIEDTLKELTDSKLARIAKSISKHSRRIDRKAFKSDNDYLRSLEGDTLDFGQIVGTASRAVVFVNNLCRSRPMRARAAEAILDIRRTLKKILGRTASQKVLLNLLKFPDSGTMRGLYTKYPAQKTSIEDLAEHLHVFNQTPPLELLQDFVSRPFKEIHPDLDKDRILLRQTLSLGKGNLDAVFTEQSSGYGLQTGRLFQQALSVNMRSFLAEEVKTQVLDLDLVTPSTLIVQIQRKVNRYREVIPVYNRLCARPEDAITA